MNIKIKLYSMRDKKVLNVKIPAYKTDNPNLFVHKNVEIYMNTGELTWGKTWVISHVPSGRIVLSRFNKRSHAMKAVEIMYALDWSGVNEKNANEFYQANLEVFKKAQDRNY